MGFFILAFMQWFPAKAKADVCGFALDKCANIKVSGGVIIGIAPFMICQNTFTDGALDLCGGIVPFAYEASRYREGRRLRNDPQPGARSRGGAHVELRTEVA